MILPGDITLRDAGINIRNPKIKARKNIFLYTRKTCNPEIRNKTRIKAVIRICTSGLWTILITTSKNTNERNLI